MFDTEREISDSKIRLCLDCGKCTVVCPVAQHDPEFNPRLIAQRGLSQNSRSPQDDTIWSCLSCYMCVERCNYHVAFPEFIHSLRAEALAEGAQLQCSHGGALQALMHLMAREDLQQDRLSWLPQDIELSEQCGTIFFVGCAPYFDIMFSDLEVNTLKGVKGALRLLNRAQVPFNILANERCCGRDQLLQGDREGFLALARANMEEFARYGVKRIITNCPECHYTLKVHYPRMPGGTGIEVVHLTEVLAPLVQSGELDLGELKTRVTYHDPCTLGRCSRIFDEPRQIMAAVVGLEMVEMEQSREKALCCGASPWVHCGAVNRQIQEQRLAQAEATGADILVTSCPKCLIHLRCAQKSGDGKIPQVEIQDLAYLAARSLGLGGESVG
ncbi:MAG: (Fe-S)-binding protein [Dehalococcoidia bacterium]|nr:MAG: (Fe-S)-binding protein [Dehalococcoidia bacterium]